MLADISTNTDTRLKSICLNHIKLNVSFLLSVLLPRFEKVKFGVSQFNDDSRPFTKSTALKTLNLRLSELQFDEWGSGFFANIVKTCQILNSLACPGIVDLGFVNMLGEQIFENMDDMSVIFSHDGDNFSLAFNKFLHHFPNLKNLVLGTKDIIYSATEPKPHPLKSLDLGTTVASCLDLALILHFFTELDTLTLTFSSFEGV